MRLNDLIGKKMVNIYGGMRMATVGESDMMIDQETGQIVAIILPNQGNLLTLWTDRQKLVIPWEAVKKNQPRGHCGRTGQNPNALEEQFYIKTWMWFDQSSRN